MCKVSVVLPVYNVGAYIQQTIGSVLCQTFQDFELLVLDDCSTDETVAKVRSISDPRLRLIINTQNMGRAGTDNEALQYIKGEYIAKMDGDDLCHPERLARQVAYLESHPEVNVVGSWMQDFGASTYLHRYPACSAAARVYTLFGLPVGNPSVMLRTKLLLQKGMRYNAALRQTEDYDFFARYLDRLQVVTLPEVLVSYRTFPIHQKLVLAERSLVANEVREQLLQGWGIPLSKRELHIHHTISMLERSAMKEIALMEVEEWLNKLALYNKQVPWFEPRALLEGLAQRWFEVCYSCPASRLVAVWQFYRSPLSKVIKIPIAKQLKFVTRSLQYI